MFMRNRTRTAKTWQKMEEMNRGHISQILTVYNNLIRQMSTEMSKPERGASSDEDERRSPLKSKRKRKKESHQMPLLERSREVSRYALRNSLMSSPLMEYPVCFRKPYLTSPTMTTTMMK